MIIGKGGEVADVFGIIPSEVLVVVEVRDQRETGSRAREVGNEAETSDAKLGLCSIEFGHDIRHTLCLPDNNHRAKVARLRLTIQRLLDTSVAHQN